MAILRKLLVSIPLLWIGFVLSISFMEAWLKFQAEGVTLPVGLSIGRLVFGALNKVELLFLIILIFSVTKIYKVGLSKTIEYLIVSLTLILLVQTFYLLPELSERITRIMEGEQLGKSSLHLFYVLLEVIKLILLIILSNKILNQEYRQ